MFTRIRKWWQDLKYKAYKANLKRIVEKQKSPTSALVTYPFIIFIELQLDAIYEVRGLKGAIQAVGAWPNYDPLPPPPNPRQTIIDQIEDAGEVSPEDFAEMTGGKTLGSLYKPKPVILRLHFEDPAQTELCLAKMREGTEVEFNVDSRVTGVSMRDVMTKPEALYVKAVKVLEFKTKDDLKQFSADCHDIYQKYAGGKAPCLNG